MINEEEFEVTNINNDGTILLMNNILFFYTGINYKLITYFVNFIMIYSALSKLLKKHNCKITVCETNVSDIMIIGEMNLTP